MSWLRRLLARIFGFPRAGVAAAIVISCSHRWPDGTSAWGPCTWQSTKGKWSWWSICGRCKRYKSC